MENSTYRIIDVNLNRAREGLRVVEEIVRFGLEDPPLTSHLKRLRHEVTTILKKTPAEILLTARNSNRDIGKDSHYDKKEGREQLSGILKANMVRAQEAMRVLEEFSRITDFSAGEKFKDIRFRLYAIEKEIAGKLSLSAKCRALKNWGLYLILDEKLIGNKDPLEIAVAAAMGGVSAIQWRSKDMTDKNSFLLASRLRQLAPLDSVAIIINDRVDITVMTRVDGVHLGQRDIPLSKARKLLGEKEIIGISTHNQKEAIQAEKEGADYVTIGPIFPTSTKKNVRAPVGLNKIIELKKAIRAPLVAIGGINETNIREVVSAGANIVAIAAAIIKTRDITEATENLILKANFQK